MESEMIVTSSTFISVPSLTLQVATRSQVSLVISGLLVEFGPVGLNVGFVDRLYPVLRLNFLHCYRNRFFSVMQNVHHVFGDCFGKTSLLLFGLAEPQLDDYMRHCSLLMFMP